MKLRHFVSGSALVLVGWLAATFMYDMPAQRYQKQDKFPVTSQSQAPAADAELAQVSASQ